MARRYYSSTAVATTLSGSLNNSSTSVSVTALSGFPNSTPWTAIIDKDSASEEVVTVTNVSGTTLTVTRGVDGTSAVSHNAGASFSHGVSARDFDEANSHVNDTTTDVHSQYILKSLISGTKGAVPVGTGSTVAALSPGSNGQTLVADSSQTNGLRYVDAQTQKNALINGNFALWQRGTSGAGTGKQFIADRFFYYRPSSTSGITFSRQNTSDTTNLPQIQYCARVQRDSGNTSTQILVVGQDVESASSRRFAGQQATLSFWARSGANFSAASSSLVVEVYSGTGTDQSVASGFTGASTPIAQGVTLTTTWQRYTITGTFSASLTQVGLVFYYTPVGTAGANDYFEITGVQLETGPVATPFEFEPYEATLRKCQRYYYRHTPGAAGPIMGTGWNSTTTKQQVWTPFPVAMRTAPTALEQNGTASHYKIAHAATTTNLSAVATFVSASTMGAQTEATVASGLTAGQGSALQSNDATAYLAWSAEL